MRQQHLTAFLQPTSNSSQQTQNGSRFIANQVVQAGRDVGDLGTPARGGSMLAPAFLGSGWTAHPLLPGRLRFDMVDHLLEGQPFELKLRFSERRIAVAQRSNKSFARPRVEGKASL